MPASPQSNDDDVEVDPALGEALGPVAEELIVTRGGAGAIAPCDAKAYPSELASVSPDAG
jgi:hypothetical protein